MSENYTFDQLRQELLFLYEAGTYADALNLVNAKAASFPEQLARTTFWKMCLLSLNGRLDEALSTFRQGLDHGVWWAESQFVDTDLDPLRDLPQFKELVAGSVQRWEKERKNMKREHILVLPDAPSSAPCPLIIALHGRNGNKESNLEYWEVARQMGWAILSPQSTQPLFPNSYCWDDPLIGVQDILFHLENTLNAYKVDRERIGIGGFSQGSGMAICTAFHPETHIRGFIGVGTWWADLETIKALTVPTMSLRCYFITGEKDHALKRAKEIQSVLKANGIACKEEVHPDLGHEFPANFEKSFRQAIDFIF
jgi:predicted esterase